MKFVYLPKGAKVVDTSGTISPAQAAELRAWGAWGAIRTVGNTIKNLTAPEWRAWFPHLGLVGVYGMYPKPEQVSAAGGSAAGALHLVGAKAAQVPAGLILACDAEGSGSAAAWEAYERDWLAAVDGSYFLDVCYDGVVEAAEVPPAAKDAMGFRAWWTAEAFGAKPPASGYALAQVQDNVRIGSGVYDVNEVLVDGALMMAVDDAWTPPGPVTQPAPATPSPPAVRPPPDPTHVATTSSPGEYFAFAQRDGEPVGERRARCWEEFLAPGPCGHSLHPERYRPWINATTPAGTIGGQSCADISSWSTSCLISQEACDHHCGGKAPPPRNGAGFFEVYPQGKLRKPDGGKTLPRRGSIAYVANTGTDGHVVCILGRNPDGSWRVAAGGGGADGTQCSIYTMQADAHGYPHDHRAYQGCWDAEDLGLPPSAPATRPDLPGLISSADDPHEAETLPSQPNPVPPASPHAPVEKGEPMAPVPTTPTAPRPAIPWPAILVRVAAGASAVCSMLLGSARAHPVVAALIVAGILAAVLGLVELARHRQRARQAESGANVKRLLQLRDLFDRLTKQEKERMATFADLTSQVAATQAGEQSAVAAISGIVAAYEALVTQGATPEQFAALTAQLKSSQSALAAAVATIPQAPPAPPPAPASPPAA